MLFSHFRGGIELSLVIIFALILALIGEALDLPIPWLLIPVVVGIIWSIVKNDSSSIPKPFNIIGQAIIAMFTASRFTPDTLIGSQEYFFPLIICIFITSILSLFNGYLIYKFADIDFPTSFLGCIPGAGHTLVAMSEEMGADAIVVAVLQYLRIMMVSVIVPIVVSFFSDQNFLNVTKIVSNNSPLSSLPLPINLLILTLSAILGVKTGKLLKIPSSLFLGTFISSLLLFLFFPYEITIPQSIFQGGLLLLGLSIGVKFEIQTVQKLLKAVLLEIILVLILITTCFVIGYWFHVVTKIDTLTAVLGSTPGGLSAMMATVIELGGDSGFVLMMQMTRMLLILLLIPIFGNYLLYLSKK
ncbi:AbrB family transcriptional regulator [Geminocystis sp. NIES-3709]|uniref:AbrB family transcriptional regulator n=1 Tax=Geminocystis sp. NIES-3709 TaxID=1617448 RepID=UPI0005FCC2E5|nr:AbrB family transcriptional regulator [Geminocystis sp. NIES-3709]BAQ64403.1 putative transmembrane protein [Geminocystis sp. NIES-3709]